MKTNHTPGPWETGCRRSKVQVCPPGWNQPMFIADCDVAWGPATEDEKCANARLIAAAPALLEALRYAAEAIEMLLKVTPKEKAARNWAKKRGNDARAAIAQAEGGAQ